MCESLLRQSVCLHSQSINQSLPRKLCGDDESLRTGAAIAEGGPRIRVATTLSEHLWTLKDAGVIYKTEWTILDKAKPCSPAARKCDLCLAEKYYILLEKSRLLNKKEENFGTCPHQKKNKKKKTKQNNTNTFYKIRIAATKKIRPDEYLSMKQICCQENL